MKRMWVAGRLWMMVLGFVFSLGCAAVSAAGPDGIKPVTPIVAKAARAVVQAQLDAFARGDAVKAYSFASPEIRKQFGDAARFMSMVRQGYPMVIRPASVSFYPPESQDGAILQVLRLRDQNGMVWRARYELRQQADKTWRINGCVIEADDEGSTT